MHSYFSQSHLAAGMVAAEAVTAAAAAAIAAVAADVTAAMAAILGDTLAVMVTAIVHFPTLFSFLYILNLSTPPPSCARWRRDGAGGRLQEP